MERKFKRFTRRAASNMLVVFAGIAFYLALDNFSAISNAARHMLGIVNPFIWGLVLAYLMDGGVRWIEKNIFRNSNRRTPAVIVMLAFTTLLLYLLMSIVLPQLGSSVKTLVAKVPQYIGVCQVWLNEQLIHFNLSSEVIREVMSRYQDLSSQIYSFMTKAVPQVFIYSVSYSISIGSGLMAALTAVISSVYMLLSKDLLLKQLKKMVYALLPYKNAVWIMKVCGDANRIFGGFISGKILDSAIIGVLCYVGSSLFGFPDALLLSVIVGVTNVIPFFGPFIGAVPCVLILLIEDPIKALEFIVFVLVLQQLDGNLIGPRILGDSTGLSPLWVLVAIIVGQGLFGIVGMIIGVPTFAVLYSLGRSFLNNCLAARGLDEEGNPLLTSPENPIQ